MAFRAIPLMTAIGPQPTPAAVRFRGGADNRRTRPSVHPRNSAQQHLSFASRATADSGRAGRRAAPGIRRRRARSGVRARAHGEARRSLQPHRHGAGPGDISRARGGVAGRDPHAARIHEGAELSGDRGVANGLAQATPRVSFRMPCCRRRCTAVSRMTQAV